MDIWIHSEAMALMNTTQLHPILWLLNVSTIQSSLLQKINRLIFIFVIAVYSANADIYGISDEDRDELIAAKDTIRLALTSYIKPEEYPENPDDTDVPELPEGEYKPQWPEDEDEIDEPEDEDESQ